MWNLKEVNTSSTEGTTGIKTTAVLSVARLGKPFDAWHDWATIIFHATRQNNEFFCLDKMFRISLWLVKYFSHIEKVCSIYRIGWFWLHSAIKPKNRLPFEQMGGLRTKKKKEITKLLLCALTKFHRKRAPYLYLTSSAMHALYLARWCQHWTSLCLACYCILISDWWGLAWSSPLICWFVLCFFLPVVSRCCKIAQKHVGRWSFTGGHRLVPTLYGLLTSMRTSIKVENAC